ncbi:MAG: hypothetical protein HY318_04850, partial [Armatimonadetes bacterium]|nr:hypothetical protein [Armatimonadota bacterium]
DAIAQRYTATWYEQAELRLGEEERAAEKARADGEVAALTALKAYVPLPEKFHGLPVGTVFDYTADTARNWADVARVVPDPEAQSGVTNRLEFPPAIKAEEHPLEKYKLPMPWGLYSPADKTFDGGATIKPEDVPGSGYNWYKMGVFCLKSSEYLYFFWSWIIQFDIDDAVDSSHPDQKFDVWARIKFEGPTFPHGKPDDKNAICVERVVLVKDQ